VVKNGDGDLLADTHNILNRWKNYLYQMFNVRTVNDIRQTEIYTAEPLVLESSSFRVEIAFAKLKRYKSLGFNQIPAEVTQAGGKTFCFEVHKFNLFGIRKNLHSSGRSL
jgi:hypothetical protein